MEAGRSAVTRRSALAIVGSIGAAALVRYSGNGAHAAAASSPAASTASCVLTPSLEIGPFFVDTKLHRSDLTAGTTNADVTGAVPLALAIAVQRYSAQGCTPLAGAHVDLWQADARGRYSDEASENTAGQTYLRGYQITDANGRAAFTTVVPGWYPGRTIHIHAMIRTFAPSGAQAYAYTT
jgi:protocatechuate 3,4-dioxygenase beta subunit